MAEGKVINFRIPPAELEGLKTLSELMGTSQTETVRILIRAEMEKQKDAIDAYNKSIKAARSKMMK